MQPQMNQSASSGKIKNTHYYRRHHKLHMNGRNKDKPQNTGTKTILQPWNTLPHIRGGHGPQN